MPCGYRVESTTDRSPRILLGSVERPALEADIIAKFEPICPENEGASTFHSPIGVLGLLQE
jgi:hypothetical protein